MGRINRLHVLYLIEYFSYIDRDNVLWTFIYLSLDNVGDDASALPKLISKHY